MLISHTWLPLASVLGSQGPIYCVAVFIWYWQPYYLAAPELLSHQEISCCCEHRVEVQLRHAQTTFLHAHCSGRPFAVLQGSLNGIM